MGKYRFSFLILLLLLISEAKSFAQIKDSVSAHKLLIIPYQPEYYLSDAEQDIMRQTRRGPAEYRAYFRNSLDLKISGQLEKILPCISLLQDTTQETRENLEHFYATAEMKYEKPSGFKAEKKSGKKDKTEKEIYDQHQAPQYAITKGDQKYMSATPQDSALITKLMNHYGTDLLLTINQFEIKTNYNSCMDIANKIYKRELFIHYNLINSKGKILCGNFELSFFPSNSNRDSDISERVFPEIASQLSTHLEPFLK